MVVIVALPGGRDPRSNFFDAVPIDIDEQTGFWAAFQVDGIVDPAGHLLEKTYHLVVCVGRSGKNQVEPTFFILGCNQHAARLYLFLPIHGAGIAVYHAQSLREARKVIFFLFPIRTRQIEYFDIGTIGIGLGS